MASGVTTMLEAVASIMQGENVFDALAKCGEAAKVVHQRLCAERDSADIEREFSHAITRLNQREGRSVPERLAAR